LLLAHSLPRDTVLLGKWIGGYISVALPFSLAVLAGFIYVYISGELVADGLWRFVAIYGLSLVYISAFFTLGLMISTLAHRTSTALLVALLVWICWILVVPNIAPVVARLAAPVPSRQIIESEKAAIDREADLLLKGIQKRKVYGDEKEGERIRRAAKEKMRKLEQFYFERLQVQIELTQNLARLSPSASFLFAATRLAGTGPGLAQFFDQAMARYQRQHARFRRELYHATIGNDPQQGDWLRTQDVPRFFIALEKLADSLDAALFDVLLLLIFNALFFMLAHTFFLCYDVT
jgi:ABC-type transport system involved in multi-copper enzyme maturation permease subunit